MLNALHYYKLLFWRFFPFFRPSWLKITGKFIVNRKSKLKCGNKSTIKVIGDFDICSSSLILESTHFECANFVCRDALLDLSACNIKMNEKAHILKANLKLLSTILSTGTNFRLHGVQWNVKCGEIKTGDFFLWESKSAEKANYDSDQGKLIIGNNSRIQADVFQKESLLTIGNNSFINRGTIVSCIHEIHLGSYVMISYNCLIFDNNSHHLNFMQRRQEIDQGFPNNTLMPKGQNPKAKSVFIGDDVWIGTRSTILKGLILSRGTVVAANTIVHKSTEEETLVYGYPNQYKKII